MIDKIEKFSEKMLVFAKLFVKRIREAITIFLEDLVYFIEMASEWIVKISKIIFNYLSRFFNALLRMVLALGELSLFYIPSVIFYILYYFIGNKVLLLICLLWFIMVTLIGIFYRSDEFEE